MNTILKVATAAALLFSANSAFAGSKGSNIGGSTAQELSHNNLVAAEADGKDAKKLQQQAELNNDVQAKEKHTAGISPNLHAR